jgi:GGDEF domain-containing protein
VGWPHDIEQTLSLAPGEQPLARALHLAELAARLLTRGDPGVLSEIQEAGARFAGPTAEQISAVIDTLEAKVQQLADVFSVRLPDRDHCLEVLVEAHAQLRETAEEAAVDLSQGGLGGALAEQARALRGVIERGAVCNRPPAAIAAAPRRGEVEGKARGAATSPHHGQTAVADDPGLLGRLAAAVAGCRQARCAVSLALMELDDLESLLLDPGPGPAASLIGQMKLVIDSRLEPPDCCYQIDDARFALIFRDCDRHQGVESVKRIVRNVQRWSERQPETAGRAVTFSVGLAALSLPPKNFPCCELIEAAERCLYGSRAAGGDGVKSILIY